MSRLTEDGICKQFVGRTLIELAYWIGTVFGRTVRGHPAKTAPTLS